MLLYLKSDCCSSIDSFFHFSREKHCMLFNYLPAIDDVCRLLSPDRRQSKTLLTIDECGSNIARNSVSIFDLRSTIVLHFDLIIFFFI